MHLAGHFEAWCDAWRGRLEVGERAAGCQGESARVHGRSAVVNEQTDRRSGGVSASAEEIRTEGLFVDVSVGTIVHIEETPSVGQESWSEL